MAAASAVVDRLLRRLSSYSQEVEVPAAMVDDMRQVRKSLNRWHNVLENAEKHLSESVTESKNKMRNIKLIAYEVEHILDELEDSRDNQSHGRRMSAKEMLCCPRSIFPLHYTIAQRMKMIIRNLDRESEKFAIFKLLQHCKPDLEKSIEQGDFDITSIIGREDDKTNVKKIIKDASRFCILPIVGLSGVGKTTLAKLVFYEQEEGWKFDLRIWISLNVNFDLHNVVSAIIAQATGTEEIGSFANSQCLRNRLREVLTDQSCLIVLDNLWSSDKSELEELKEMLGSTTCSVIVTTCSEEVAELISTVSPYKLGLLSDNDCGAIFSQIVSNNEDITQQVVRKCKGMPVIANSLGAFVHKNGINAWNKAKDEELWHLQERYDGSIKMFQSLKQIYYNMPSGLKSCFQYLSILPDKCVDTNKLIRQWIALDMLGSNHGILPEYVVGKNYVQRLMSIFFLQSSEEARVNASNSIMGPNVLYMHSLVHNFATYVASDDLIILKKGRSDIARTHKMAPRYALLIKCNEKSKIRKDLLSKARAVRFKKCNTTKLLEETLSVLKHVYVLDLSGCSFVELPSCLDQLKHLRYLDISESAIRSLPTQFGNLQNLEALDLSKTSIVELPDKLGPFEKLKYLNLQYCCNIHDLLRTFGCLEGLEHLNLSVCLGSGKLPETICDFTELQFMELSGCTELENLPHFFGNLRNLGELNLSGCFRLNQLPETFIELYSLRSLNLASCSELRQLHYLFGNLRSLEYLNLSGCSRLEMLPESFGDLYFLRILNLAGCSGLQELPEFLGNLSNLECLNLSHISHDIPHSLRKLKRLHTLDLRGCGFKKSFSFTVSKLENLKILLRDDSNSISDISESCETNMAESMVFQLLQKITATLGQEGLRAIQSPLGKEAPALLEVQNHMRQLEKEFTAMKDFLMQAEMCSSHNLAYRAWLDDVKKVSYDAEDIIDEYAYLIARTTESRLFKKLSHHSKNVNGWHKIADELKQIEERILKLISMKDLYGISTSGEGIYPRNNSLQEHTLDTTYVGIEDDIVGIEEKSSWLMDKLIHGQDQRTIISIWGMGGVGKTTLVRCVYQKVKIKQEFDCFAWFSVSQSYNVDCLLKAILKQLLEKENCSHDELNTMDRLSMIERMANYLQDKRYLIVLDDLWSSDAWLLLDHALARKDNRSRIVITTRIKEVASLASDEHCIQLETLGEDEAWELFCRKAFQRLEGKACPPNLIPFAEDIVSKCKGSPLAIVTVGGLMSRKKLDENEWNFFCRQLDRQQMNDPDHNSVTNALDLTISHLQGNLKNCFLYCGLFPVDHEIKRKYIIRLWIAEGFVEERGPSITMEEVADEYLQELYQSSLLQVVERNAYGRAKAFKLHGLVKERILSMYKRDIFSVLMDEPHVTMPSREARHVAVLNSGSITDRLKWGEKIRSFILFDFRVPSSWVETATGNFRLLRVLSLRYANIEKLPHVVTTLFNLRYLDLFSTKLKMIPEALCNLRNLQMLDLAATYVVELPRKISRLTKLRYLRTGSKHNLDARMFDCFQAAKVRSGVCSLKDLQVLGTIEANNDIVVNLGNLTQLRQLSLAKVMCEHIKQLWNSITRMPYLSKLTIISNAEEEVLDLESLGPLPNLERLFLKGKLQVDAVSTIFHSFRKLQDLRMEWSRMQTDPILSLSHILNLVELHLCRVYEGQMMIFQAGWFPKLKKLYLADMERLSMIKLEDGTMQTISYVKLVGLRDMLAVPAGFRYLTSLQEMVLEDMPEEFIERLQGEDNAYTQHIQRIICADASHTQKVQGVTSLQEMVL